MWYYDYEYNVLRVCCFLIEYTHIDHVIYFLGRVLYSWRLCWKSRHLPQEVARYVLWNKKGRKLFSKNPNKIFNIWVVKYVNHFLRKAFQTLPYFICMDSGFSVLPVRIHADIFCPGYNPWSLWSRQTPKMSSVLWIPLGSLFNLNTHS